jgi:hypothetical protein
MLMPRSGLQRRKRPVPAGNASDDSSKRIRGRPKKPARSTRNVLDLAPSTVDPQEEPVDSQLSALERLPTEIIQYIFFECLEIHLMAVSRTLRSILTDKAILRTLILFAYNDPVAHGDLVSPSKVDRQVFQPANFKHLEQERRRQLQMDLPRVPGFGLASLLQCLPALCGLAMLKDSGTTGPGSKIQSFKDQVDDYTVELIMCQRVLHFIKQYEERSDWRPSEIPLSKFFRRLMDLRQELLPDRSDIDDALRIINVRHISHGTGEGTVKCCVFHSPVIDVLGMPPTLITGKWTTERLMLVQLLGICGKSGRDLSWFRVLKGFDEDNLIFKALDNGLEQRQITAFLTLLNLYLNKRPTGRVGSPYAGWSSAELPLHLYQKATELGDASEEALGILFRYDNASFPLNYDPVTRWALEQEAQGSDFGAWLLKYLRRPFHYTELQIIGGRPYQDGVYVGDDMEVPLPSLPRPVQSTSQGFNIDLGYNIEPSLEVT